MFSTVHETGRLTPAAITSGAVKLTAFKFGFGVPPGLTETVCRAV